MNKGVLTGITLLLFAIPAWPQETGWIGIRIEDQKERGAIVRSVEPDSPAAKAGLKEGDIILEFNRDDVIGVQQFMRLIRETPVGRSVELKVRRDNRDETLHVTTESGLRNGRAIIGLPDASVLSDRIIRSIPRIEVNPSVELRVNRSYVYSGVRVEQLTDQLREFFGVPGNTGVLVSSVDPGSAAEKAGVKAGDVITSVGENIVRLPAEFNRQMRAAGSKTVLKVVRDKQEREIPIE